MSRREKYTIRRLCTSGALLFLLCGSIAACLYPPVTGSRAPGEEAPQALSAFVHKTHEEALKKEQFHCTDCHLYDLAYMARDEAINKDITKALTRAGMESCHFCHRERPERAKVALKCLDCHVDLLPILPANHRAGWRGSHGTRIAQSDVACSQCHSNRFCVRCHTRRDEADRAYHTGSAIVSHPIEARADPVSCQRCHNMAWCKRCHKSGRF